jgi:cytochrome c-type biogenesis protein CcmE
MDGGRRRGGFGSVRMRSIVGLGLIAAIMVGVVVQGARSATDYYVTVSQVAARPARYVGRAMRVEGNLLVGSVRFDARSGDLWFRMGGGRQTLAVYYHGAPPEDFTRGARAIVQGTEVRPGVIAAQQVLVQCPDHYKPVPDTQVLATS